MAALVCELLAQLGERDPTVPLSRVGILLAADATNVFLQGEPPFSVPRTVRLWARLRL